MTPVSSKRLRAVLPAALVVVAVALLLALLAFGRGSGKPHADSTTSTTRPSPPTTVPLPPDVLSSAPPAAEGPWTMLRSFTFTGDKLDTSIWSTCYPRTDPVIGCRNFGNDELEWYLPSQDAVSGGALHLVAVRSPTRGRSRSQAAETYPWRSGMVTTYGRFSFRYGYMRVRARYPAGPGFWSALWLLDTRDYKWPEIDLEESTGRLPHNVLVKAHFGPYWKRNGGNPTSTAVGVRTGWHYFALDWEPTFVAWYIDGHQIKRITRLVPHVPMFFLADLAVDGRPPNGPTAANCVPSAIHRLCTPATGSFDLKSVQIWQRTAQAS